MGESDCVAVLPNIAESNCSPLIGILCIDIAQKLRQYYGAQYYSYISAAYVKYVESVGGRPIPIWINRPRSYYEDIMKKVNGIMLPGGAVFVDRTQCTKELHNDCVESSKIICEIAIDMNKRGEYFPLWGTCLGFQLMLIHSANAVDIRRQCSSMIGSLPIKFESDTVINTSRLLGKLDETLKCDMTILPFAYHFHQYCVIMEDLINNGIADQWTILGTNVDFNGLKFISLIEHKTYPFFGSQFHPEHVYYEYLGSTDKCVHSFRCLELTRYFAKFFIYQCSLNRNHFENEMEELRHLIYNFPIEFTAPYNLQRQQCYLFKENVDYPPKDDTGNFLCDN